MWTKENRKTQETYRNIPFLLQPLLLVDSQTRSNIRCFHVQHLILLTLAIVRLLSNFALFLLEPVSVTTTPSLLSFLFLPVLGLSWRELACPPYAPLAVAQFHGRFTSFVALASFLLILLVACCNFIPLLLRLVALLPAILCTYVVLNEGSFWRISICCVRC